MPQAYPPSEPARTSAGPDLESELAVVGLVRDGAATLPGAVRGLAAVLPAFRRVRWCVIESDSSDGTVAALEDLARSLPGFTFRSLGRLREQLPERTRRIAHCRNAYLDWLHDEFGLPDSAYVLVADLDGVNARLTREGLLSCWQREDWAACTANQIGPYYDIWALRHPEWCAGDCWRESEFLARYSGNADSARRAAVYARMVPIPADTEWIEVESAFGGLALYRAEVLRGVRYDGLTMDGREVCEHVSMNAQIRAAGGRIYINPRLVNADSTELLQQYWPERARMPQVSRSLVLRALLRLVYGRQASKEMRRLLRSLE